LEHWKGKEVSKQKENKEVTEAHQPRKDWREVLHRIDDVRWELPIDYMPGMRVPGLIFADDVLMETMASDMAVEQVANVATLPGIVGHSIAMPDIHWGYGFPIGGVAATRVSDGVVFETVTLAFGSRMDCVMFQRRVDFPVFGVVSLESRYKRRTHAARKIRIFAVGFVPASPARVAEDVYVR
jgi:hypothetical protein